MNRRLVIFATDCSNINEASDIFIQRGWQRARDQSIPLPGKKLVRKDKHSTHIIDLEIEELEYGGR